MVRGVDAFTRTVAALETLPLVTLTVVRSSAHRQGSIRLGFEVLTQIPNCPAGSPEMAKSPLAALMAVALTVGAGVIRYAVMVAPARGDPLESRTTCPWIWPVAVETVDEMD
jgi:hypothetical protein